MSEWRDTTLGEVLTFQRGFDLTEKTANPGPIPVISSGGSNYTTDIAKISGPGVITGRKGVLGKVHWSDGPYWPHDTTLWVKDFKGSVPRFIYYLLQTLPLSELDAGAANPTLNRNHAHLLPVHVPDTNTQSVISETLRLFDDLIENNRRRVAVLEEMARTIYREWFVKFRYPGHEDVPLVDSELGSIPEGWTTVKVAELCSRIQAGSTPRRSTAEYWDEPEVDWYKTGDLTDGVLLGSSEKLSAEGLAAGRTFEPETILMAIYGSPTVGRLGLLTERASANQAALGMMADKEVCSTEYLWFVLRDLREYLNLIAQGAAQQNVSKEKVASCEVLLPTTEVVRAFTDTVSPIWRLSHSFSVANRRLASIRDMLLPKLVTGKIDVSTLDLDALVKERGMA